MIKNKKVSTDCARTFKVKLSNGEEGLLSSSYYANFKCILCRDTVKRTKNRERMGWKKEKRRSSKLKIEHAYGECDIESSLQRHDTVYDNLFSISSTSSSHTEDIQFCDKLLRGRVEKKGLCLRMRSISLPNIGCEMLLDDSMSTPVAIFVERRSTSCTMIVKTENCNDCLFNSLFEEEDDSVPINLLFDFENDMYCRKTVLAKRARSCSIE